MKVGRGNDGHRRPDRCPVDGLRYQSGERCSCEVISAVPGENLERVVDAFRVFGKGHRQNPGSHGPHHALIRIESGSGSQRGRVPGVPLRLGVDPPECDGGATLARRRRQITFVQCCSKDRRSRTGQRPSGAGPCSGDPVPGEDVQRVPPYADRAGGYGVIGASSQLDVRTANLDRVCGE